MQSGTESMSMTVLKRFHNNASSFLNGSRGTCKLILNIFFFNKAAVHASSINLLIHSQKSKQERNKISRIQNPSDIIIFFKVYFFGVKPLVIFIGKKLHLSIFTKIAKKLFRQLE